MKSKCLCFFYPSYHLLNLPFSHLTVWTERPALYARGTTPIVLNTLRNSYLNKATKCLCIFIFAKFSYRQRNPLMKQFKTEKKALYHLENFNCRLSFQPRPCLRGSFWLLKVVRHFYLFLWLSWFLSVWKYPNALCNSIAICCIKPVKSTSKGVLPRPLTSAWGVDVYRFLDRPFFTKFTLVMKISKHHCQLVQKWSGGCVDGWGGGERDQCVSSNK